MTWTIPFINVLHVVESECPNSHARDSCFRSIYFCVIVLRYVALSIIWEDTRHVTTSTQKHFRLSWVSEIGDPPHKSENMFGFSVASGQNHPQKWTQPVGTPVLCTFGAGMEDSGVVLEAQRKAGSCGEESGR